MFGKFFIVDVVESVDNGVVCDRCGFDIECLYFVKVKEIVVNVMCFV